MRKHYTETRLRLAELIDLVAGGRAAPRVAAARLGVTEPTAYHWLKRARQSRVLVVSESPGRYP